MEVRCYTGPGNSLRLRFLRERSVNVYHGGLRLVCLQDMLCVQVGLDFRFDSYRFVIFVAGVNDDHCPSPFVAWLSEM